MSNSKYKLIRCYPDSPELGTVVALKADGFRDESGLWFFSKNSIENFPEFWEKIVEEYEVLSSYNNKITSIKRLSDNEIFKIGDLCYPKNTVNNVHPIEDIDILGSGKLRLGSINWYANLEDVVKLNITNSSNIACLSINDVNDTLSKLKQQMGTVAIDDLTAKLLELVDKKKFKENKNEQLEI